MNTQILEYIIVISEEHSITRAAERFYISQPSLSHHLSNLEKELGVKLFQRQGRSLEPTREGIIFINSARAILHAENAAKKKIQELQLEVQPRLRVCGRVPGAEKLPQQVLQSLEEHLPQLRVEWTPMDESLARSMIEEEKQDLALIFSAETGPVSQGEVLLAEDTMVLSVAETVQMTNPEELCYFRWEGMNALRSQERKCMEAEKLAPRLVCTASTLNTAVELVKKGYGIAFLPNRLILESQGKLRKFVPVREWPIRWTALLGNQQDSEVKQGQQVLIGLLKEMDLLRAT